MKRFIIVTTVMVIAYILWNTAAHQWGWYIDFHPDVAPTTWTKTVGDRIYVEQNGEYKDLVVRGVNMGSGLPGEWSTDYDITAETYTRWFTMIKAAGANVVRVYAVLNQDFYDAFYAFNEGAEEPLYLIQGVWVNDKVQNSHADAFDRDFYNQFVADCRMAVDVIHGNRHIVFSNTDHGSGNYRRDISPWVLGYIIGVEWEDVTVAYTDEKIAGVSYAGPYLYTSDDASAFETMLAQAGDKMIAYESSKYKRQRLLAFSNWPTDDPFEYSDKVHSYFKKCAFLDVEHILSTSDFIAGQFVSYHVYPYYPDYLYYSEKWPSEIARYDSSNTYLSYLKLLTAHHSMPVMISEFGVSTGRGMAQQDHNTGRNQGNMSEDQQGAAFISCYEDIIAAGCVGGCIFSWQDEWFKRTWNTMLAVDLTRTPYWSDYQTNEQFFGLLAFDPGKETSVCYVDGDVSEWSAADVVSASPDGAMSVAMKYDEKFVYLLVRKEDFNPDADVLYVPIDTTPKSGSTYCENYDVKFERFADFLLVIDGRDESRLIVQERYEFMRAMYCREAYGFDAYTHVPELNTPVFKTINLLLQIDAERLMSTTDGELMTFYETGKLTYGNANPRDAAYNSLADFIFSGDCVEVRLPWQMLNFSDPSVMRIHDDYYEHYGTEALVIDRLYLGIGSGADARRIAMSACPLQGWDKVVTSHERLKQSYYMLQQYWTQAEKGEVSAGHGAGQFSQGLHGDMPGHNRF